MTTEQTESNTGELAPSKVPADLIERLASWDHGNPKTIIVSEAIAVIAQLQKEAIHWRAGYIDMKELALCGINLARGNAADSALKKSELASCE